MVRLWFDLGNSTMRTGRSGCWSLIAVNSWWACSTGQRISRIPCKIVLQELTLSETRAFFADAFPDGYPEEALKEGHELCRGVPRDLAAGLKNSRRIMSRNGLKAPTVEVISKAFRAGVL